MDLTFEQARLVFIVYVSSLVPLIIITYLYFKKHIPRWVPFVYFIMFIICALGWELWFTYGLINGDNVDLRRAEVLSRMIPININWLLNSLADAGTICFGGLYLTWQLMNKNRKIFYEWSWKCFFIFLIICLCQNIIVEMYLYHDQLSIGKYLSWAPLSPMGQWFNPILFEFNNRTIFLQNQIPWILTAPLFYTLLIYCSNNCKK